MSDMATELKPRKITVLEYRRMAEIGILRPDERLELLDGAIFEMSPLGWEHAVLHSRIVEYLLERLKKRASIFGMASVALGQFSEPQPDIVIADPSRAVSYRPPTLEYVFAVIEISDSSLRRDMGVKRQLYATFSLPDYLVVDVKNRVLQRFRRASDGGFLEPERMTYGDMFTLTEIPDVSLEAAAFLPPQESD